VRFFVRTFKAHRSARWRIRILGETDDAVRRQALNKLAVAAIVGTKMVRTA
jgi:hypothetical protein